jgi:hypothetical protein
LRRYVLPLCAYQSLLGERRSAGSRQAAFLLLVSGNLIRLEAVKGSAALAADVCAAISPSIVAVAGASTHVSAADSLVVPQVASTTRCRRSESTFCGTTRPGGGGGNQLVLHQVRANTARAARLLGCSGARWPAKRAPKLHHFSHFFIPVRGGWRSCDFVAPQAGSTALGNHGAESNALKMAF